MNSKKGENPCRFVLKRRKTSKNLLAHAAAERVQAIRLKA